VVSSTRKQHAAGTLVVPVHLPSVLPRRIPEEQHHLLPLIDWLSSSLFHPTPIESLERLSEGQRVGVGVHDPDRRRWSSLLLLPTFFSRPDGALRFQQSRDGRIPPLVAGIVQSSRNHHRQALRV